MVSQNSCLPVKFYKISCIAYAHETNLIAYEVSVYNACNSVYNACNSVYNACNSVYDGMQQYISHI